MESFLLSYVTDEECVISPEKSVKRINFQFTPFLFENAHSGAFYTIAHSKRRPEGFGVFDCALATVTLSLLNLLCYIQHLGIAEMAIYKSAV